jgi:hypothetical protein
MRRLDSGFPDGLQPSSRLSHASAVQRVNRAGSRCVLRVLRWGNKLGPTAATRHPGEHLHNHYHGKFDQPQSLHSFQSNGEIEPPRNIHNMRGNKRAEKCLFRPLFSLGNCLKQKTSSVFLPIGKITLHHVHEGCQPAFRVGPTVGPLSISDRSKCYLVLLKVPRKLLTLRSLQTCQGSDVESAESAIGFGRRLQRREIAGLRSLGSFSIPTAPTNLYLRVRNYTSQRRHK